MSLQFVLAVECGLTHRAFVGLLTCRRKHRWGTKGAVRGSVNMGRRGLHQGTAAPPGRWPAGILPLPFLGTLLCQGGEEAGSVRMGRRGLSDEATPEVVRERATQ